MFIDEVEGLKLVDRALVDLAKYLSQNENILEFFE